MIKEQFTIILDETLKSEFNADHTTLYEHHGTANYSVAMNYSINISYRDLAMRDSDLMVNVLNKIKDKVLNSNLVKSELNKKDIQIEIIKQDLERLNKEVEDLKRYKIFYDMYKDLKDGV